MAKHVSFSQPWMADYLKQHKLTFEGYVLGTAQATICCDVYMVGALSHMWNVSITIVCQSIYHHGTYIMIPRSITLLFWQNGHSFGRRTHYLATQKNIVRKHSARQRNASFKSEARSMFV